VRHRKHVLVLNGHPDSRPERFAHALASAYARGAREAGHDVRIVHIGSLQFPLLRTATDFEQGKPPTVIAGCQADLRQADHVVVVFPLWLGAMPALLKGYFEQVLRPGFAFEYGKRKLARKLLKGKSARVVVTMGMPAALYRWAYRAHSLKSLERNILGFCGIRVVGHDVIGLMGEPKAGRRERWLAKMEQLGRRAA
jgi:putative NADPH-quinone reductase